MKTSFRIVGNLAEIRIGVQGQDMTAVLTFSIICSQSANAAK
jgi:hypothetical protein